VFLPLVLLVTVSSWGQAAPHEHAYTLTSFSDLGYGNDDLSLPSVPEGSLQLTATNSLTDSKEANPSLAAVNDLTVPNKLAVREIPPCAVKNESIQVVTGQSSETNAPTTLTVRTAALLELHAMRQNAVDLCLQLPAKYRTQLPQCADIFKREIRLEQLAKEPKH
jgi:hypothetical protein